MVLKAWYKMDNDATDSSGNDYDCTESGTPTWVTGLIEEAVELNGTSQYLYFNSHVSNFVTTDMTIAAWIYANNYDEYRGLFYIYESALSDYLIIRGTGTGLRMLIEDDNVGVVSMATGALDTAKWVHVAFVYDGVTWRFYYNGVEATFTGTNAAYSTNHLTPTTGWIGRSSWASAYWDGNIDDLRVYNHALTPKEVKELSLAKVGHWNMDSLIDQSGYGNHLTNYGATLDETSQVLGFGCYNFITDDYMAVSANNTLELYGDWSVSLWMKFLGTGTGGKAYWTTLCSEYTGSGYDDQFHFWFDDVANYEVECRVGGDVGNEHTLQSTVYGSDNAWHHAVVTFEKSTDTFKFYVDDGLKETYEPAWTSITTNGSLVLGRWGGYADYLNGEIDDIKIYGTVLSSTDVSRLYKGRATLDGGGNLWL